MPLDDLSRIEFPEKCEFLFRPARYKVLHGGRGGAKSWSIARALIILASMEPKRILCAREFQNSISESVHHLLADQIRDLGLEGFFDIQQAKIIGLNGSEFIFAGIRQNINNIKSYEAVDIVWVEEAVNVSKRSWSVLIPTIRKEGSEIWISFNPELETDETYKRFILDPPDGAVVVEMGWRDNPWFPKVLHDEMMDLKRKDPQAWLHVWEGKCTVTLDGAIYAKELFKIIEEGRRTKVKYDPRYPVDVFFDLGRNDLCALWFRQQVMTEKRYIDYYADSGHSIDHYIKTMQDRPYTYGTIYLPHDGRNKMIHHPLSIEQQIKAAGYTTSIVPNISVEEGINLARQTLGTSVFDEELTQDGWLALSHYQYEIDDVTKERSRKPLHNWASNGADAFRYSAVGIAPRKVNLALKTPRSGPPDPVIDFGRGTMPSRGSGRWMGR